MAPIMICSSSPLPAKRLVCALGLCLALLVTGCESPGWARSLNAAFTGTRERPTAKEEEAHRREYLSTHSRRSMHWLLGNCVETGMSHNEVSRILGEEGIREAKDNWVKTKGGTYQLGDEVYGYGPNSDGETVYLVFRDNQLVSFEGGEFRRKAAQ